MLRKYGMPEAVDILLDDVRREVNGRPTVYARTRKVEQKKESKEAEKGEVCYVQ